MITLEERGLAKSHLRGLAQPLGGLLVKEAGRFIPKSGLRRGRLMAAAQLIARRAGFNSDSRIGRLLKAAILFGYALARYDASAQHVRSGIVASYSALDASMRLAELLSEAPAALLLDEDVLFDVVIERLSAYILKVGKVSPGLNAAAKWAIIFGYAFARYES